MSPDSLDRLPDLVTADVRFADPFNDARGIAALKRVMQKTMHDLPQSRFAVTHRAWDGDLCLMGWTFEGRTKGGRQLSIVGMSELAFAPDGKVARHIDH